MKSSDRLLDMGSDMQAQRDRAVVQRAGMEGDLWHAETLLKQAAALLPKVIATSAYDAAARDALLDQVTAFLAEAWHHPELPDGVGGGEAAAPSGDEATT